MRVLINGKWYETTGVDLGNQKHTERGYMHPDEEDFYSHTHQEIEDITTDNQKNQAA